MDNYGNRNGAPLQGTVGSRTSASTYRSKLKRINEVFTMAGQPIGETLVIGELPAGAVFSHGLVTVSASTVTATIAIGVAGTADKYKAAAAHTTADVPELFGKAAAIAADPLDAAERVIATIGTAALPGAGTLVIDLFYSDTV